MRKSVMLIFLFSPLGLIAQDFQGYVTYKTVFFSKGFEKATKDTTKTLLQRQQFEGQIRFLKAMGSQYTLIFDPSTSIYTENKKLMLDTKGVPLIPDDPKKIYKNLEENYYKIKMDLAGNRYLIKDSLKTYEWSLVPGQKNIKGFTCYKATFTDEVVVASRPKQEEDGSFTNEPVKRNVITTAWYTPQIPISNGPKMYGGLPGLILEVNLTGGIIDNTFLATDIVINPKKKLKITAPKGEKVLTEQEFKNKINPKRNTD
ncbi:GLPGLI family protein [Flavobacteriaceae bacterium F08102]|nr:GLPGLI family protein [Flavobacteriaceae bacterium F08102]